MKKLVDFEFFLEGDYSKYDKGIWTEDDFKKAYDNFKKAGIDIPIILNPKSAHDTKDYKNRARVGFLNELFRKPDGRWSGNGEFLEEVSPILEKKIYDHKSVGLVRLEDGGVKIDHIALVGAEKPQIAGLKLNHQSIFKDGKIDKLAKVDIFSQSGEAYEFSFAGENNDNVFSLSGDDGSGQSVDGEAGRNGGEDDGSNADKLKENHKMSYSDEALQLALTKKENELNANHSREIEKLTAKFTADAKEAKEKLDGKANEVKLFSDQIAEKDKKITELTGQIDGLNKKIEEQEKQFADFSWKLKEAEVASFIKGCKAIEPAKYKEEFATFCAIRKESETAYQTLKKSYEENAKRYGLSFGIGEQFKKPESGDFGKMFETFSDGTGGEVMQFNISEAMNFDFDSAKEFSGR